MRRGKDQDERHMVKEREGVLIEQAPKDGKIILYRGVVALVGQSERKTRVATFRTPLVLKGGDEFEGKQLCQGVRGDALRGVARQGVWVFRE